MKILALTKLMPGATEEATMAKIPQEAPHVWQRYVSGVIRDWYHRQDRLGGRVCNGKRYRGGGTRDPGRAPDGQERADRLRFATAGSVPVA